MTNEQAIKRLKHLVFEPIIDEWDEEALNMAIEALSAQPEILACGSGELDAQPERRTGHWINISISVTGVSNAECNQCGCVVHNSFSSSLNYCPNCGAEMRGE